jgi:hypothetical protein
MITTNFINEIGNKIKIIVQQNVDGVQIIMVGPSSEMENNITLKEAIQLYTALGNFFEIINVN